MASRHSHLAKTTRPKLHRISERKRLFTLLDQQRMHPVIWVSAQAGAGKTSLVASYLTAKRLQGIWYQMDGADADPATFFHFLRNALKSANPRSRPLPLLTPEYLADLPGFARRFFATCSRA